MGIPIYEERGPPRSQSAIQRNIQLRNWKDDEWSPERIIQYYGPATWAEYGSWGYWTPIYMLNCIIQFQAVVEIITNETAKALNILAKQDTKIHNAIYQNCLALDCLLDSEGICGKFNLSTWKGWNPDDLLGGWFSTIGGFKTMFGAILIIVLGCIIIPCLLPLVMWSVSTLIEAIAEQKTATQLYLLQG
jgi:hypothetical protein